MDWLLPSFFFLLGIVTCGLCMLHVNRNCIKRFDDYKTILDKALANDRQQISHYEKEIESLSSNLIRMQSISPKKFEAYISSIKSIFDAQIADLESERKAIICAAAVCSEDAFNCLSEEEAKVGSRIDLIKSVASHLHEYAYLSAIVHTAVLGTGEQLHKFIQQLISTLPPEIRNLFNDNTERHHDAS